MPRRLRVSRLQALTMTAASGAYSWAGFNANLSRAQHLTMTANTGIYQWAGQSATLQKQKFLLTATRGLYTYTGQSAIFTYTPATTGPTWSATVPNVAFTKGSAQSPFLLSPYLTGYDPAVWQISTLNGSLETGISINSATPSLTYDDTISVVGTSSCQLSISAIPTVGVRITNLTNSAPITATNGQLIAGLRITSSEPNPCITIPLGVTGVVIQDCDLSGYGNDAINGGPHGNLIYNRGTDTLVQYCTLHNGGRGVLNQNAVRGRVTRCLFSGFDRAGTNNNHGWGSAIETDNCIDQGGLLVDHNTVNGSGYQSDAVSFFQSSYCSLTDNIINVGITLASAAPFIMGDATSPNDPGHNNYIARNTITRVGGVPAGLVGSTGSCTMEQNCILQGIQAYNFSGVVGNYVGVTIRLNVIGPGSFTPDTSVLAGWSTNVFSSNCADMPSAAADFQNRIAGPSVVWYHNFDAAAEVNQFRFVNAYNNDPLAIGPDGNLVSWVSSGGADGGGFMRLTYPLNRAPNTAYWARPFFPIDAAGTGRGAADPGAGGTIATQSWVVSDKSTTNTDALGRTNPGFYGPAGRQAVFPAKFQGTDYYIQVRVRRAQNPGLPPDNATFTSINGKFVWFTCTGPSFTTGEIVTFGQSATIPRQGGVGVGDVVGQESYHNAYTFTGDFSTIAHKTGGTVTINNELNFWRYSGGWDTLLYHVTPGEIGGTGNQRTRWEVWAQHDLTLFPAEAGQYTKIWDVLFPAAYETGTDFAGHQYAGGWNCLNLAIYHNIAVFTTTSFNYDYDQVIFSKATIPAPTV